MRRATHESSATWEGDLHKVVPLRATMTGMMFKLHFVGVPECLMTSVIIPGFEKDCQVNRLSQDEE